MNSHHAWNNPEIWDGKAEFSPFLIRMDDYGWLDWYNDASYVMDDHGNAVWVPFCEPFKGFHHDFH